MVWKENLIGRGKIKYKKNSFKNIYIFHFLFLFLFLPFIFIFFISFLFGCVGFVTPWLVGKDTIYTKLGKEIQKEL